MEHTGIDLLLLHHLRLLEILECLNQLLDPLIHLLRSSLKDLLEVLICSLVDLLGTLGRRHLLWKQNSVLGHHVLDLVLQLNGDLDEHVGCLLTEVSKTLIVRGIDDQSCEIGGVLQQLHGHAESFLAEVGSL